jgi:hypothetical protein
MLIFDEKERGASTRRNLKMVPRALFCAGSAAKAIKCSSSGSNHTFLIPRNKRKFCY